MKLNGLGALGVIAALALGACGTTEPAEDDSSSSGEKITITDSRGKKVTLDGPAVRVAGTEWNVAEYLLTLGVKPVGISDVKGYKAWNSSADLDSDVTDIGTRGEPSIDTLASLDLDALFVTDTLAGDAIKQIEKTTPVIVVAGGDSQDQIGQMFENVDIVAKATGTEDEAKDLRAEFDDTLAATKKSVAESDLAGAKVAFSDAYETGGAVSVRPFTAGSQLGDVLGELGFEDAWASIKGIKGDAAYGLGQTDVEGLTKLPEDSQFWYIANDTAPDPYGETLAKNKVWTSLPFVEAGQVERLPDRIWMFGGPESMIQFMDAVNDIVS